MPEIIMKFAKDELDEAHEALSGSHSINALREIAEYLRQRWKHYEPKTKTPVDEKIEIEGAIHRIIGNHDIVLWS